MKIVNFVHWSRSGITSLTKTIIEKIEGIDHHFILLNSDNEFDSFYSYAANKYQLDFSKNKFRAIFEFGKLIRKIQPNIIHSHSFMPFLLASVLTKKSIKIIYHVHCDYPYLTENGFKHAVKRWLIKYMLNHRSTINVAVSESSAKAIKKISKKECLYLANGIEDVGTQRNSFIIEPSNLRFYSVSRLDKEKNIPYSIDLIEALIKKGLNVTYDIYGNGAAKEGLTERISRSGLNQYIKLKGFHSNPECLPSEYDFYLSTSTQEGLSLSALQSLRGKTPLITTPVGQIGTIINHGYNGFILSGQTEADIRLLLELVTMDVIAMERVQHNARKLYLQHFQTSQFIEKISSLYTNN